jgi:adenosylmethionine-8-amino-7-oxononanoate aminotransferase
MGGVERAPPGDGLRWGRRVCAASVGRGVLLRPLGDIVVLMPPLTISSEELHTIVHALAAAIDEVTGAPDGAA